MVSGEVMLLLDSRKDAGGVRDGAVVEMVRRRRAAVARTKRMVVVEVLEWRLLFPASRVARVEMEVCFCNGASWWC